MHRWKYNIKVDLREIWCKGMNWIHLAENKVHWQEAFCEHSNHPSGSIKDGEFLTS
jgi:hypothetical protein